MPLDAAGDGRHARFDDDAALLFEEFRPDEKIGDAGLVFDSDEHHAVGGARHLPDEHEANSAKPRHLARGAVGRYELLPSLLHSNETASCSFERFR